MLIVAIVSQKGGAGKSPTAVHLSYALARAGNKTLFVDADAQASSSLHFLGVGYTERQPTLYNALISLKPIDPIVITERLHFLSSHDELSNAEVELTQRPGAFYQPQLLRLLKKYSGYDIAVIDTPGSNISIFTTLGLTAATFAVVTVKTEFSAERATVDTMNLIADIKGTEENPGLNPQLEVWGILPTQFEANVRHHKDVLEALKDQYGGLVYSEPSRKTNKYNDATALQCDIGALIPDLGNYWDRVASNIMERAKVQV